MKQLKAAPLRDLSVEQLHQMVWQQREALFKSRRDLVFRQITDTSTPRAIRHNIARILTIIREKESDTSVEALGRKSDRELAARQAAAQGRLLGLQGSRGVDRSPKALKLKKELTPAERASNLTQDVFEPALAEPPWTELEWQGTELSRHSLFSELFVPAELPELAEPLGPTESSRRVLGNPMKGAKYRRVDAGVYELSIDGKHLRSLVAAMDPKPEEAVLLVKANGYVIEPSKGRPVTADSGIFSTKLTKRKAFKEQAQGDNSILVELIDGRNGTLLHIDSLHLR